MGEVTVDSAANESCWPKSQRGAFPTKPSRRSVVLKTASGGGPPRREGRDAQGECQRRRRGAEVPGDGREETKPWQAGAWWRGEAWCSSDQNRSRTTSGTWRPARRSWCKGGADPSRSRRVSWRRLKKACLVSPGGPGERCEPSSCETFMVVCGRGHRKEAKSRTRTCGAGQMRARARPGSWPATRRRRAAVERPGTCSTRCSVAPPRCENTG